MTIDDFDTIETSGGQPPRSTLGERGVLALAMVALVGGALVAFGHLAENLAPSPSPSAPAVAKASPTATPRPTASPAPTPTPLPTPQIVTVQSPPPPSPTPVEVGDEGYYGWITIRGTVQTRQLLLADAPNGQPLTDGEVAWAETAETPGWLRVQTADYTGYLEPAVAKSAGVVRSQAVPVPQSGGEWGLVAGGNGFVATVYLPSNGTTSQPTHLAFSSDGNTWRLSDFSWDGVDSVVWGPAGWLAIRTAYGPGTPSIEIARSADGLHWTDVGIMADALTINANVYWLVGSARGYLLETGSGRGSTPATTVWVSQDGRDWMSVIPSHASPSSPNAAQQVIALPSGFYRPGQSENANGGSFSPDGEHWSVVPGGPVGEGAQVAQLGDRLIGLARDTTDGSARIYVGTVTADGFQWDDPGGRHFGALSTGIGPPVLASDGHTAVILSYDWSNELVNQWTSHDGLIWAPSTLAGDPFGTAQPQIAGGQRGIVLVGSRTTLRGPNPIFWHRAATGAWRPESRPLMRVVADLPPSGCPRPPRTVLEFMISDASSLVTCIGHRSFTFDGWSVAGSVSYDQGPGIYSPTWLAAPSTNQIQLSPINLDLSSVSVVLDPRLGSVPDPSWRPARLSITGHFDDAAAATCRWLPDKDGQSWYASPQDVINMCRFRFVVTGIKLLGTT